MELNIPISRDHEYKHNPYNFSIGVEAVYVNVTRRSRMTNVVKKGQIFLTVLYTLCLTLKVEGKPQLYSCTLKVRSSKYTDRYDSLGGIQYFVGIKLNSLIDV